jgi:hypothetical protein
VSSFGSPDTAHLLFKVTNTIWELPFSLTFLTTPGYFHAFKRLLISIAKHLNFILMALVDPSFIVYLLLNFFICSCLLTAFKKFFYFYWHIVIIYLWGTVWHSNTCIQCVMMLAPQAYIMSSCREYSRSSLLASWNSQLITINHSYPTMLQNIRKLFFLPSCTH